jgi:hypothetical protein
MFKKILFSLIVLLLLLASTSCRPALLYSSASTPSPSAPPTILPSAGTLIGPTGTTSFQSTETPDLIDLERRLIEQVDRDRALADLGKLTGEAPICDGGSCHTLLNRLTGSEGLQWAKQYIRAKLVSLGYSVEVEAWSDSGYADENFIVRKVGVSAPEEEVYFVAHMDGVKKDSGEQFPAADDNASGVVDLLELARILDGQSLSRTLVLFFSTGEEQGTLGVTSYLDHISRSELRSIKAVVDIDMIGYDANRDSVMEIWHGDHPASRLLAESISATIQAFRLDLQPTLVAGCG